MVSKIQLILLQHKYRSLHLTSNPLQLIKVKKSYNSFRIVLRLVKLVDSLSLCALLVRKTNSSNTYLFLKLNVFKYVLLESTQMLIICVKNVM